jgi:hypothetical protein
MSSRIGGPSQQPRVQVPKETETPKPVEAPKTANAAKVPGFSDVSSFKASAPVSGPSGGGAPKLSPNDLGVLAQNQGNTNACGTTSLANVMTYWGMPRTHEQIDKSIRPFDLFSAPDKLVSYARDNGLRAEIKNDASLDDLAHMVDQGVPPVVLMDPDSDKNANLHYISVTGYNRDANGKISDLVIADSAGGYRYTMPAAEFQKKWDNLKMGGVGIGLNNVMITTVPKDGRMITGGDGVARSASDIQLPKSSFWSNLESGPARKVADLIANGGGLAESVGNTAKHVWKSIFG